MKIHHLDIKNVIQTTEGRKNLGNTYVNVHEILRRFAPLNDNQWGGSFSQKSYLIPNFFFISLGIPSL